MISNWKLINFEIHGDEKGWLVAIEENKNIDFEIKRVFYIFGTQKGVVRGKHALKKGKQLLICISGSCKILVDDGYERKEFLLNKPDIGLIIEGMVWREMYDFSENCVLSVLSDSHFDEKDYINSYEEFLKMLRNDRNR